ncbi:Putative G-protein coupled receptor F59B2.13 [Toxocara canis]|uniref:Putative G-protein coupled receptor F59B2.13 n=1 Tax=Toxocara canis TaxID=6265 RepID=A0A0B2VGN7_TOXCA|nr:Putative G-protein coupled receptor F59B2.13 [Toxocara canis]
MRNRANHLLAALAFADMAVFFLMLPTCFAAFSPFYTSISFRIIFGSSKIHLAAVANWFSCAAIWIVLAVSIERLLIIKFPFRSLKPYHTFQSILAIFTIFLLTFLLTSYHHVSHKCTLIWLCNMTQVHVHCLPATWNLSRLGFPGEPPPTYSFISFINLSAIANALIGVIVPVFVVALLNISLIRSLHRRNTQELVTKSVNNAPNGSSVHEQERKMTITVVAIISCFTITQMPSALLFLYEKLISDAKTQTFATVSSITNFLVLTGKMLNVVLFCLTSISFRRKFFATVQAWLGSMLCVQRSGLLVRELTLNRSCMTQKTSLLSSTSPFAQKPRRRSFTLPAVPLQSLEPLLLTAAENQ